MKAFLSNDCTLSQIQNRLSRYAFLTKSNLPGYPDALIFLTLTQTQKFPDPKQYPYFYHWFILIKQFSDKAINSWLTKLSPSQDDNLAKHLLSLYLEDQQQTSSDSIDHSICEVKENNSELASEVPEHEFSIDVWSAKIKQNCNELLKRQLRILRVKVYRDFLYGKKRWQLRGDSRRCEQTLKVIERLMEYRSLEVKKGKHCKNNN